MNKRDYDFIEEIFGGCMLIKLAAYFIVGIAVAIVWTISFVLSTILNNKENILNFFAKVKKHLSSKDIKAQI